MQLKNFVKRHPVLIYWLLAMFLAALFPLLSLPLANLYPHAIDDLVQKSGKFETIIPYLLRDCLQVEGGLVFFLFMVVQTATPAIAALITAALQGKQEFVALTSRWRFWSKSVGWKKGLLWWLVAIGVMVAVKLGMVAFSLLGQSSATWPDYKFTANPLSAAFWAIFLLSLLLELGGLEETGWRGFALPELQKKHSPLKSSVLVGAMWMAWHIPSRITLFLSPLSEILFQCFIYLASMIPLSILFTYFFNKLGGSTLIGFALHGLSNDPVGLAGSVGVFLSPQLGNIYQTLMLAPLLFAALAVLGLAGRQLGLDRKATQ